ncbi:MAG: YihY/virulence factor BrkB family protein [Chloroflexi bacterium]|nr:YihY/virulence factor BrkB family protein [Chloroflexota bacterium]
MIDPLQERPIRPRKYRRPPMDGYFGKVFRILRGAFMTFTIAKGPEASASIAYYTLFSLFPLLLTFVAVGSFFLDQGVVELELIKFLPTVIPVSQDFILENIRQIFEMRGGVSILALIGLLWSSTAVFSTIIRNINAAWPDAAPHSFLRMRLWSLAVISAMAMLLILSSFSLTLNNIAANLGFGIDYTGIGGYFTTPLFANLFSSLIRVAIFFGLYFWVPQIKVKRIAALTGAVVAAFVWQLITFLFNSYLGSGLARYEIIYGSLGKIVALLAWIYFSGWIILFGAHLTSSMDRHT